MFAPEIYDQICYAASEDYDGTRTLLSLVQTSRTLHATSIKYLWQEVPNLCPLMNCLPEDAWDFSTQKFRRELQFSDLTRFCLHANNIRSYGSRIQRSIHNDVDVKVYKGLHLVSIKAGQPLLPNVAEAFLDYGRDFEKAFLAASIFGDKVRKYRVDLPSVEDTPSACAQVLDRSYDSKDVISAIFAKNANLQRLTLTPALHPMLLETFSNSLYSFTGSLRRLNICNIPPTAAMHISRLPLLEKLRYQNRDGYADPFANVRQESGEIHFPSLRSINIQCDAIAICISVISLLPKDSQIIKAKFRCWDASGSDWKQLISLLSERCEPSYLERLSLDDEGPHLKEYDDDHWNSDYIEPMLAFHNLRRFDLDTVAAICLNDGIVERMAHSWKNIETLRLFTQHTETERHVTLNGIQALAENCPNLDLLTMHFNARLPAGGPPKLKNPSSCKLDELNVMYSPIDGADLVASFLQDCFPHLKRFSQWDDGGMTCFEEWDVVQEELELEEGGV